MIPPNQVDVGTLNQVDVGLLNKVDVNSLNQVDASLLNQVDARLLNQVDVISHLAGTCQLLGWYMVLTNQLVQGISHQAGTFY